MIVPTPNKIEINGKRNFSKAMEVEVEDSKASKRKKRKLKKELVEVGSNKMKKKIQGPTFEV